MVQEELVAVLAVVVVVVVIVATLMFGLWLGFGREISYEEAMASKIAKEESKEKVVPATKSKKKKLPKKKSDSESVQEEEKSALLPKPILKAAVEKAEALKVVEFDVQTPQPKKTERPPLSPPTPHPAAMDPVHYAALLSGTEDDEVALQNGDDEAERESFLTVTALESMPLKDSTATSATLSSFNKDAATPAAAKKTKTKRRSPADYIDSSVAGPVMSIKRIEEAIAVSPLLDEEVESLVQLLIQKKEENAEWQGAAPGQENTKSLKKQHQALQGEYAEAQKTILAHNSKIKELRAEITAEKERHSMLEKSQQARVTQQNNAIENAKSKIALLEKQIEGLKVSSTNQQLDGEKIELERHVAALSAKNSGLISDVTKLTTQVSVLEKEIEKKKSKEKTKTPQPEVHPHGDGAEMERLKVSLRTVEGEKDALAAMLKKREEELESAKKELERRVEELSAKKGTNVVDEGLQGAGQSELAKALAEKEELCQQIVQWEQKLNDLKEKNSALRDSNWKARDDAATAEKASKEHLNKMMAEAEKRCKQAKKDGIMEAQMAHKTMVEKLFPDVTSDEKDFSRWIDVVETAVKEQLEHHKQEAEQLLFQRRHVQELEDNERRMISEAQHLRDTLRNSMDVMERVKGKVEITSQTQLKELQEEKLKNKQLDETNKQLDEENKQLDEKNKQLDEKNKQLDEKWKTEQSVSKQLQEQLAQKDTSLKEAELKYQTEKESLLQQSTDATQKQLGEQIEKNQHMARDLATVNGEKSVLETSIKQLSAELAKLKAEGEQAHQLHLELTSSSRKQLDELTKRNHDLEHKLTAEEAVKTELIKKIDQLSTEVERLKAADEKQHQSLSEVKESSQKHAEELMKKNDQLSTEVQKLSDNLKATEERDRHAHSELETNQKHLDELTKRNHDLEHKLTAEEAFNNESSQKHAEELSKTNHELEQRLASLEEATSTLSNKNKQLTDELQLLNITLSNVKETNRELNAKVADMMPHNSTSSEV